MEPLEFRCYRVNKLKYTLCHIHLRLMAAILKYQLFSSQTEFSLVQSCCPTLITSGYQMEFCCYLVRMVRYMYSRFESRHVGFLTPGYI